MAVIHRRRPLSWAYLPALGVLLVSCSDPTKLDPLTEGAPETPRATSVVVSPDSLTFSSLGATEQLTATVRDQNNQTMSTATVTWQSSNPSVATVDGTGLVTSVADGSATITATAGSASGSAMVTVADACNAIPDTATLGSNPGELSTTDCQLDSGNFVDFYTLELANDATLQIDLTSGDFDAFLTLFDDQANNIASDDDSGGSLNSRIVIDLQHGTYVLGVTSVTAVVTATTGSYVLDIAAVGCPSVGALSLGSFEFGTLTDVDCLDAGGFFNDSWTLSVDQTSRVQADLISGDFDAWLIVLDETGAIVAEENDSHSTGDAQYDLSAHIDMTLDPGTYEVLVSTFGVGEVGSYQLNVGPGLPCAEESLINSGVASALVASLEDTDCLNGQFFADAYAVRVPSTGTVTFDLTSGAFDTFLTLYDPAGNIIGSDDDGGAGTDSRISMTLAAGWYVIEASSFTEGTTGEYTLSVN